MALPNLTRDDAAERAALVTVENYRIELDLTDGHGAPGERTFRSTTTVEFSALAGADTVLDLAAETVHRATLNGTDVDVADYDEATGIALTGLAEHNVVVVEADCRYSNTGEGLHRFVDPVDDEVYLYSQFETADAKRMFACFDQPDLKATFDVTVTAHRTTPVTVTLADGGVVAGRVVDRTGRGVAGARIVVPGSTIDDVPAYYFGLSRDDSDFGGYEDDSGYDPAFPSVELANSTDAAGRFEVIGVRPGRWSACATDKVGGRPRFATTCSGGAKATVTVTADATTTANIAVTRR